MVQVIFSRPLSWAALFLLTCSSDQPIKSPWEEAIMKAGIPGSDFYERGLLLKKAQIFDMALAEFQQATKDPQQAGKAFAQMALCLKTLRREDEAVTAFRQALATGSFSTIERVHIQYVLAQTLESIDREFEALVVYRRIRQEYPNFQDVDARIQDLSSGKLRSHPRLAARQGGDVVKLWGHLKPQLTSLLEQTWQRLARYGDMLETPRPVTNMSSIVRERAPLEGSAQRCPSAAASDRSVLTQQAVERRRQDRIAVQMLSQFFSKAHTAAGEGEVRDLSPSGCRITSPLRVPLGTAVECWIYPQDGHPFAVEEATVQWLGHREFGLRFSNVRLGVQRQITDMCRKTVVTG
jgi:tetratricopeptide (TPR) repeat protein